MKHIIADEEKENLENFSSHIFLQLEFDSKKYHFFERKIVQKRIG